MELVDCAWAGGVLVGPETGVEGPFFVFCGGGGWLVDGAGYLTEVNEREREGRTWRNGGVVPAVHPDVAVVIGSAVSDPKHVP